MEYERKDEPIGRELVRRLLPRRDPEGHKGTFGKVLCLCGSVGYTGAPVFASRGAVRSGAGLVFLGVPESIWPVAAVKSDEAMPFPLPEAEGRLSLLAEETIRRRAAGCDAVLLGCGLGRGRQTDVLVRRLMDLPQPLVLVGRATDVLSLPKVQGVRMLELERGCLLCRLPEPPEEAEAHTGWAKVALLDGRTGYVRDVALEPVRFEMTAVFSQREGLAFDEALAEARKITAGELVPQVLQAWYDGSEEAFRDAVCAQAKKYLGTEYRWGGKSGRGIDCSGLVSSAYMQCGVLIYRDARIVEGWPMHQIPFADKKRGDALYFPGHIALYLGEGRYIHSTGASVSGGVVINSLDPADPLYREDLVKSLYAVGSVF